ncbi:hypothetical protein OF83DRAFT_1152988, partial [Amylostereum chailletii]
MGSLGGVATARLWRIVSLWTCLRAQETHLVLSYSPAHSTRIRVHESADSHLHRPGCSRLQHTPYTPSVLGPHGSPGRCSRNLDRIVGHGNKAQTMEVRTKDTPSPLTC